MQRRTIVSEPLTLVAGVSSNNNRRSSAALDGCRQISEMTADLDSKQVAVIDCRHIVTWARAICAREGVRS